MINVTQRQKHQSRKKNIENYLDQIANYKKDDVEKLNVYNDYKQVAKVHKNRAEAQLNRLKDKNNADFNIADRFFLKSLGEDKIKAMLNEQVDSAIIEYNHSSKRAEQYLRKLKNTPIKEIESYRIVQNGAHENISWMGTKYVRV